MRRQMEGMANSNTIPSLPFQASEFLSTMAATAQNSLNSGRIAAVEIVLANSVVRNPLREGKT